MATSLMQGSVWSKLSPRSQKRKEAVGKEMASLSEHANRRDASRAPRHWTDAGALPSTRLLPRSMRVVMVKMRT
jgi:hypothetical protein